MSSEVEGGMYVTYRPVLGFSVGCVAGSDLNFFKHHQLTDALPRGPDSYSKR